MKWKIPLFKMHSTEEDINSVSKVIKRGTYWADGPEIRKFEKKIANYIGTKYALSFNSGTSALHVLLLAHDIKGKEVIVPSFTFIATANAVILAGGIPIFAESETDTFGLDAKDVKKRITKKTKAIITIHYGGFPAKDTKELKKIADQNNILFIEDAAESLGAKINERKIGSFGHSAMFSFCQNKVLTTGEGGMIVTNDKEVYERAKVLRSHGRVDGANDYFYSTGDNDYIQVGYSFRMPTICAALGLSQFNNLQGVIKSRIKHANYLNKNLSKIKGISIPKKLPNHYQVYQMYTIKLNNEKIRNDLQQHLTKKSVMSKVYFEPIHLKEIYKRKYMFKEGDLPKTESLSKRVLNIPLYPDIKEKDLDYIIKSIKEFFE